MKNMIIFIPVIILFTAIIFLIVHNKSIVKIEPINIDSIKKSQQYLVNRFEEIEKEKNWQIFIQAMIIVESQMNNKAVGDNGSAIGILQIRPIMLAEYHRIIGEQVKVNRKDPMQSLKVFNVVQAHHNPKKEFRRACDIWNKGGGDAYYDKIMDVYNKLKQISE